MNQILDKDISRITYYNYKRKLYDNQIFQFLKESYYDTKGMRCVSLGRGNMDKEINIEDNRPIAKQLPDREDTNYY